MRRATIPIGRFELPVGIDLGPPRQQDRPDQTVLHRAEGKPFYGFGSTDNGAAADLRRPRLQGLWPITGWFWPPACRVARCSVQTSCKRRAPICSIPAAAAPCAAKPYQSLGVTVNDAGTDVRIGGNQFLAGSLETRVKVTDTIGIVGFVDMGSGRPAGRRQ